jgi:hypothetical protein
MSRGRSASACSRWTRGAALAAVAFGLALPCAPPAAAQAPPAPAGTEDAFLDPDARVLHARARARWHEIDATLLRYQAIVSERVGAALRMPLRDRTLYSSERSARIIWERNGGMAVQMLAASERLPSGFVRDDDGRAPRLTTAFDPAGDPLLLGISDWDDDDEMRFEHPLDVGAELHYRFRTADTLTLSFPDGRVVRAVQLEMVPRRDDPHLLSGALWIEPESGNLVRAVYRLARPLNIETDVDLDAGDRDDMDEVPGLFRPFIAEISIVAVDYALWDLRVWMPRSLRAEGTARAGIVTVPVALEVAYELEEVVTVDQNEPELGLAAAVERLSQVAAAEGETEWKVDVGGGRRRGRRVRYVVPEDLAWLRSSPHLPAPIWEDDRQFASPADFEEMKSVLADVPGPARVATMATFDWGMQRPDLIRYNRIEGLSVGARGAVRFGVGGVPLSASLTARLGSADVEPRLTLAVMRETLERALTLSAYRELQLVEPSARAFGPGNTVGALLFGRDDGDYYQTLGVGLAWTPPSGQRAAYRARVYAERQDSVIRGTHGSVFHWVGWDDGFRESAPAVHADQVGAELTVSPWWGHDPRGAGAGFDLQLQGERGHFDFGRARLQARAAPLDPGRAVLPPGVRAGRRGRPVVPVGPGRAARPAPAGDRRERRAARPVRGRRVGRPARPGALGRRGRLRRHRPVDPGRDPQARLGLGMEGAVRLAAGSVPRRIALAHSAHAGAAAPAPLQNPGTPDAAAGSPRPVVPRRESHHPLLRRRHLPRSDRHRRSMGAGRAAAADDLGSLL